jgi:homoserine dehydrogenase
LIGGCDPATDLIEAALARGKHVITANKKVIAESGTRLHSLADLSGARLYYSAAVGGAVPMLEAVERVSESGRITSLRGVVNGTTTFVLNELARGITFDDALRSARACGLAEADATLDLNGTDAAHKLVLLIRAAFGVNLDPSEVDTTGILDITPEYVRNQAASDRVVRLVASVDFDEGRISARVCATVLLPDDPLARTQGAECCLVIGREGEPEFVLRGKGAGRWPTTESVMADLFSILRTSRIPAGSSTNQELTFAGGVQ